MERLPDCMYEYRYEAPRRKVIDTCVACGEPIYEHEECYGLHGDNYCKVCAERCIDKEE